MRYPSLRPPFICPWKTEGCQHVTLTNAADHRLHVAEHERELEKRRSLERPKATRPYVKRTRKFLYTFSRKRSRNTGTTETQN